MSKEKPALIFLAPASLPQVVLTLKFVGFQMFV